MFLSTKEQPAAGETPSAQHNQRLIMEHDGEQRQQEHQQQQLHVKEENVEGWVLKTAPARRGGADAGLEGRLSPRGEEAGRRVVGGGGPSRSSDRWAALQVSIPRLQVNGPTAKVVADGGSSSGSATAATIAAALSGVSSMARVAGVQANPASTGIGEGDSATLLVRPPSDVEINRIAPGNGVTTASAAKVAASSGAARADGRIIAVSSLFLTERRPLSLPAVRGIPEGALNQPPSPPTSPSKNMSPVEIHVNEEGGAAVYRFNKSAPTRRGKWSRMEEEYAKRIIRDFDEGVLDAPAGIGLRQLLSSKLHCEVMRVSKKFCGWQCVGKRCYRPVFHHDGRTTRARASLFEMEQNWLKTFPSPSRAKPVNDLERSASLSPDAGVGSCKRGSTAAQAWLSREERGLAGDTSTGAGVMESPAEEGRPHRESSISVSSDEEPRDAPSGREQGEEVERQMYDRGLVSPVAGGGDRQQVRAVSRSRGYEHRFRHSVGTGSGDSVGPNDRHGVKRWNWTSSSSHGSHYMQGGAPPGDPVLYPREQHRESMRSPPASLSLWQRAEADRPPSARTGGCDRDADLYPVFSERGEGGGGEVSGASGNRWAQEQDVRPHQRQPQFPPPNIWREESHARENTDKRHREGISTTVNGGPAGLSVVRREHGVKRPDASASDQTYPDPFPHYESRRQREASGSYISRSNGGNGGRVAKSDGGRSPTEAAFGRRPFRLKPKPAALPLHLRVDSHRETLYPGNGQAPAPKPGRYLPEASYGVGPPPEPSSKEHRTSRRFSEGPEHHYYSAKEERSSWEDDLAAGLEEHRPAKTARAISGFFHLDTSGSSGGRGSDDRPVYPRYRKHEQQPQLQQERRHPGTAMAIYWQSGRTGDNGEGCAAVEAYTPMEDDATPPRRPPSRDCFFRVSASPISMVVPSNEYGSVAVGPRG